MRLTLLLGLITWHAISCNANVVSANLKEIQAVTRSINTFNNDLFKAVADFNSGNLIFSPISTTMVLSMAAYGARGQTAQQLHSVLGLGEDNANTTSEIQSLIDSFDNFKRVELRLANRIFVANSFKPKAEFLGITKDVFRSKAESLDFEKPTEASEIINKWCQAKTNNRIKDLFKPDELGAGTAIVLINAAYFKGFWKQQFNVAETKPRPFHVTNSMVKDVPTMQTSGMYRVASLPEIKAQSIELPYESQNSNDAMSMIIILPNEIEGLAELEKNLGKITIDKLLDTSNRSIRLSLPKFKIESTIDLRKPLSQLGLDSMFTSSANFTGIVDAPPLKVSKVLQKAFIEVNEVGSEAAAVTAIKTYLKSALVRIWTDIQVDHPFLYLITARSSKTVIFQGRVANFS